MNGMNGTAGSKKEKQNNPDFGELWEFVEIIVMYKEW